MNEKRKAKKPEIKVTVKNKPAKEEARLKLKQLGEFLSNNSRQSKDADDSGAFS